MIRIDNHTYSMRAAQAAEAMAGGGPKFNSALLAASGGEKTLGEIFSQASTAYRVPQALLKAVAYHESGFKPDVVSRCGAMGVMQLMPDTARAMGVRDPFDAEQNIMGGAKLLGQYLQKYDGDLRLALAAYGAGSGSVAKYGGVPPFEETRNFVEDILSQVGSDVNALRESDASFYQKLVDQLQSLSYTPQDYRLFLLGLLQEEQDSPFARQQEEKPLFYLGL